MRKRSLLAETAEAAKKVEAVLAPHFAEEEEYAMPLLGLLEVLAHGQQPTEQQAREALNMSDTLRKNYDRMLDERLAHCCCASATHRGRQVREEIPASGVCRSADAPRAKWYPAALLVGDYLKLRAAVNRP